MSLDEFRRAQEALPAYESMSYYRKWASALTAISIERGLFSAAELDTAMGLPLKEEVKLPRCGCRSTLQCFQSAMGNAIQGGQYVNRMGAVLMQTTTNSR